MVRKKGTCKTVLASPLNLTFKVALCNPTPVSPDSVYTERYMGSPHVYPGSNYKGYEAADATKMAGNLKDKMFLLIHGTADDNVHYHHSMMLAKSLVDEGVLFQQMVGGSQVLDRSRGSSYTNSFRFQRKAQLI